MYFTDATKNEIKMKSPSPLEQTNFLNVSRILNQFYNLLLAIAKKTVPKMFLNSSCPNLGRGVKTNVKFYFHISLMYLKKVL